MLITFSYILNEFYQAFFMASSLGDIFFWFRFQSLLWPKYSNTMLGDGSGLMLAELSTSITTTPTSQPLYFRCRSMAEWDAKNLPSFCIHEDWLLIYTWMCVHGQDLCTCPTCPLLLFLSMRSGQLLMCVRDHDSFWRAISNSFYVPFCRFASDHGSLGWWSACL